MQPPKTTFLPQIIFKITNLKATNPLNGLKFFMPFACHSHAICMSLVCTRMSSVCHSDLLVCHPYVTRMHSYVTCMYSYGLLYHPYVTRMWFYHEPVKKLSFFIIQFISFYRSRGDTSCYKYSYLLQQTIEKMIVT